MLAILAAPSARLAMIVLDRNSNARDLVCAGEIPKARAPLRRPMSDRKGGSEAVHPWKGHSASLSP